MDLPTMRTRVRRDLHETRQSVQGPSLKDLKAHVMHIPPVSPWPTDARAMGPSVDMKVVGDDLLISGRNLLAMYKAQSPDKPVWAPRRPPRRRSRRTGRGLRSSLCAP